MSAEIAKKLLIEGEYYRIPKYGTGIYIGIEKLDEIKYYIFEYCNGRKLYIYKNDLLNISKISVANDDIKIIPDAFLGEKEKNKCAKEMILTETKKALLEIESYKNILTYGINNIEYSNINPTTNTEIENLILSILNNSVYPKGYDKNIYVKYDSNSNIAIINYKFPNTLNVPRIVKYTYDRIFGLLNPICMKQKEFNNFYESILFQITLRTIKEIFTVFSKNIVESVVFNGVVESINKKTGHNFSSCILSVMTSKENFDQINLLRVSPKECIMFLKGLFSGPLYKIAPVKPILDINREDKRFIQNKKVLSEINEGVNLAEISWEDFEHLVRELFEKIFNDTDSRVNVTQTSRDGGVDAVVFDADPIKGGKFIIQAKRYNNVVPVSAARDLYGTVINEGANKGILVTTSYFSNDSREFVKNKPITLIDGSNIIYLLNKYGYKSYIELKK